MKGLILRELYLTKKGRFFDLLIALLFVAVGLLVALSMSVGNLSKPSDFLGENDVDQLFYVTMYAVSVIIIFTSGGNNSLVFSDYTVNWVCFSRTTPISERKYTGTGFLVRSVLSVIGLAAAIGYCLLLCTLSGRPVIDGMLLSLVIIWAIVVSLMSILTALTYFCRTRRLYATIITMSILVTYVILVTISIASEAAITAVSAFATNAVVMFTNNMGLFALLSPFVCTLFVISAWLLSAEAVKRRGK